MSAIASFYVIPGERLTDIVGAATPAPAGWFRAPRDRFWDTLRGASRELETFAFSGWVFNTLDLYLENRHGFMLDHFGDTAETEQMTKARGSYWLVLPAASAGELLAALDGVVCETTDATSFVEDECGPSGVAEGVAAVQAALAALKAWLPEVTDGSVGLLNIG